MACPASVSCLSCLRKLEPLVNILLSNHKSQSCEIDADSTPVCKPLAWFSHFECTCVSMLDPRQLRLIRGTCRVSQKRNFFFGSWDVGQDTDRQTDRQTHWQCAILRLAWFTEPLSDNKTLSPWIWDWTWICIFIQSETPRNFSLHFM